MKRTVGELARFLGGRLVGRASESLEGIADLEAAGVGDLSYAEPRLADRIAHSGASCVLVSEGDFPTKTTITVSNPKVAFARAASWLLPASEPVPGVHSTAVIGNNVSLAEGVSIGAHVVIEDDTAIGASTLVRAGSYIGPGCQVGQRCRLQANVVVYPGVVIGDRVSIHAGAVLGADGFGYVRDNDTHLKFPQAGRLVIEDDVEIGANTTIDRGSLGLTLIEKGVKLDNLCHVAHNVRIGARTLIAAQTGVSGSCDIGEDAVIAGQVGVADHVRIDAGAIVGAQCGIPSGKRIRAGEVFWGTPARPLKDIKVQHAHISRLPRMAKDLGRLREELEELRDQSQ